MNLKIITTILQILLFQRKTEFILTIQKKFQNQFYFIKGFTEFNLLLFLICVYIWYNFCIINASAYKKPDSDPLTFAKAFNTSGDVG